MSAIAKNATEPATDTPGIIGRLRSRQAGHPTGLLGRVIGRLMVKDTASANDRALDLLQLADGRTVLEVGFGQGRTAAALVAAGHRVLGVEVSSTMVKQARARNRRAERGGRVDLRHGDGISVPFEAGMADAALTVHTIYFMPDPAATLADVARVLRPGGRLVVACRVGDDPMPRWMDPAIYRMPSTANIVAMLRAAGFEVTHHEVDDCTHWFVADLPA